RVQRIGDRQPRVFRRRDPRGGLVHLRARRDHELGYAVADRRVDDIEDPFDADLEDGLRLRVEELGAVHRREVNDRIDTGAGPVHRGAVADIAAHDLDVAAEVGEPPWRAAGVVVEDPDGRTVGEETPHDRGPD